MDTINCFSIICTILVKSRQNVKTFLKFNIQYYTDEINKDLQLKHRKRSIFCTYNTQAYLNISTGKIKWIIIFYQLHITPSMRKTQIVGNWYQFVAIPMSRIIYHKIHDIKKGNRYQNTYLLVPIGLHYARKITQLLQSLITVYSLFISRTHLYVLIAI